MFKMKKTPTKKRANRGLAFILGIQKNRERAIAGNGWTPPLKPLQMTQMSSQGFEFPTRFSGESSSSEGRALVDENQDVDKKVVRISSVPKFVTAADSLAVIRGENGTNVKKRIWGMCSSEPAVRGFRSFPSPGPASLVNESSPASGIGTTSKYFGSISSSQSDWNFFPPPNAIAAGTTISENTTWNPFKRPDTVFQSPWITREASSDDFEIQSDQENVEEELSDASIQDMINSMCEDDEQEISAFF